MSTKLSRRRAGALVLAAFAMGAPLAARAKVEPILLSWRDLVPGEADELVAKFGELGVVQHGELSPSPDLYRNAAVTQKYNGQVVKLPGYALPMSFAEGGIKEFILVPFVGACIHVPPPPPNQLVIVTVDTPYRSNGPFAPVYVTGRFDTAAVSTDLAQIGYTLAASKVERFEPSR